MVRSSPAVAALLVLMMFSGRMLAVACEAACLYASVPHGVESASRTTYPGHGCHQSASDAKEDEGRIVPPAPHTACGHEEAIQAFVVASKSAATADAHAATLANAPRLDPVNPAHSERQLLEHSPPGAFAARVIPLRI